MGKQKRQEAILALIRRRQIATQDELVRQLERLMPPVPRESLERYAGGAG